MRDVTLPEQPEPADETAARAERLARTDETEAGLPRAREQRVVTQEEIDEADSTGSFAVTEDESAERDAGPDSPARI